MEHVLACIDASSYAESVCDLAGWAALRLGLPVELLHVVQRRSAVPGRHDLSGAIGLGVKGDLLEELTRLEATDARLQVARGRVLLEAGEARLRAAGARDVHPLHRHGGIVETILEREAQARLVVIGKRGADHDFAPDHIGSNIERVVRASSRPVLVAARGGAAPTGAILAYDASPAARRAVERVAASPLFAGLPVRVVTAGADTAEHRRLVEAAREMLAGNCAATADILPGRPEDAIAAAVADAPGMALVMGAYGHSPLRRLVIGSLTTAMIRTVHAPVLLVR